MAMENDTARTITRTKAIVNAASAVSAAIIANSTVYESHSKSS